MSIADFFPNLRPDPEALAAMKCPDCGGMPARSAKWAAPNWRWKPGRFCSCPYDEAHP